MSSLVENSANPFVQGMTRQAFELLKTPYEVIIKGREDHMKRLEGHGYSEVFTTAASGYDDFMTQTNRSST
jgi:hypothetical protein